MVRKINKKTAFGGGIALAGVTQLSRNKKIRNVGGFALFAVVMGTIGQGIGFLIKWIIWEPCMLIVKGFYKLCWWVFKAIYYYPIKYGYKGLIYLYKLIKTKYEIGKTVE